jgi:AcrR family transcriptional regulator
MTAPRRGRPPRITPELILDAVDRRPDSSWTVTSIAAELGVSEPAIYYHFPSKQALLFALGARVLNELEMPSPDLAWEPWLEELAHRTLALYRHHWVWQDVNVALIVTAQPAGVRLLDRILSHLVACGFTLQKAAIATASVLTVVEAVGKAPRHLQGPALEDDSARRRDIAQVSDAPLAASLYGDPSSQDVDSTLRQMLAVVLSGIRVELAPRKSARGRRVRS